VVWCGVVWCGVARVRARAARSVQRAACSVRVQCAERGYTFVGDMPREALRESVCSAPECSKSVGAVVRLVVGSV
jgi:hypothetical protein